MKNIAERKEKKKEEKKARIGRRNFFGFTLHSIFHCQPPKGEWKEICIYKFKYWADDGGKVGRKSKGEFYEF